MEELKLLEDLVHGFDDEELREEGAYPLEVLHGVFVELKLVALTSDFVQGDLLGLGVV